MLNMLLSNQIQICHLDFNSNRTIRVYSINFNSNIMALKISLDSINLIIIIPYNTLAIKIGHKWDIIKYNIQQCNNSSSNNNSSSSRIIIILITYLCIIIITYFRTNSNDNKCQDGESEISKISINSSYY